jgi:uncharacterized protein YukE
MSARPPDFEPLAAGDPVPGDPDEIAALGRRYADTAAEIARQAANLRKLATAAPGGWKGQAGTVFHSHAADLATRISQAHERYATAGKALQASAEPMHDAQQRAYAAVWQAKAAQQQMAVNAPGPPRPPGSPPLTDAQKAQQRAAQASYDDAQSALAQAGRNFDQAVHDYKSAAAGAARQIGSAISHDGLKDSWWDRNFGWISTVFKIVAIVVLVLAVVALVLAMPWTAAFIVAMLDFLGVDVTAAAVAGTLTTASTWIGWGVAGVTAVQAAYDGTAAATGKESWTAFALDMVALVTFSCGKAAEIGAEKLAESAAGIGRAVASARAGRAAMRASGLPGLLYSLGSRFSLAAKVMRMAGMGGQLDAASQTAANARAAVASVVKAAGPTNLATFFTMSNSGATDLSRLSSVSGKVPGVLRIEVAKGVAYALMGVSGTGQWGSFIGTDSTNVISWTASDPGGDPQTIISSFRQSLSRVP